MPVRVIDTLKPKNGLNFPIVEAIDVFVENYGNLADAISHFATDAMIAAINAVLSGKANAADVNTAVNNLQGQINQIVISASSESIVAPEVAQARVGTDGTEYTTLNERITAERNEINTELARFYGTETDISSQLSSGRILTTDPINLTPETSTDYLCGVINCSEGDVFHLIGTGASGYRMWAFIDSNNHILSEAEAMPDQTTSKDVTITAPANAVKLVVNFRIYYVQCEFYSVSGGQYYADRKGIKEEISSFNGEIETLDNQMDLLLVGKKTMFSDTTLTHGYFVSKDTGELVENANYIASDYVDVSNIENISLFNVQQSAYYNASKLYMGNFGNITTTLLEETEFPIPEGAAYIRCSIYNSREETAYYKSLDDGYSYAFKMSDIENDAGYIKSNDAIYVGATREYKTLRSGVAEAIKTANKIVYVDAGTYDLTEEFAAEIQAATGAQFGIRLDNNVHIIFSSGAVVSAIYTGGNTTIESLFAPFYVDSTCDFTLENLTITAKNTRYCVHDESGGTTGAYRHKYINCKMTMDNVSATIGKQYYPQCIGGGLGQYGSIDIEGCYFKTKRAETERTTCVSYHNNASANSKSYVNVRDCYFADDYSTFRVTHHGTSTEMSEAIICNCSLGVAPYVEHEGGETGVENMSLLSYLNEIRNDSN